MDQAVKNAQEWLNDTYVGQNGYTVIDEDGKTGQSTIKALIIALQIELGISSPNGTFGTQTTALCPTLKKDTISLPNNKIKILQHGLFCKGYSTKIVTGIFGDFTEDAIILVETDAGLNPTGIVTPLIFKTILNTDPLVLSSEGDAQIRYIQQTLNKTYYNYFGIIPTNGIYERNTNKALIYALQAEEGLAVGTANGSFGTTTQSKCPTLKLNDTRINYVKILQYGLKCNNISVDNLNGNFNESTRQNIIQFQKFVALPQNDGVADLNVWMSLLTSKGNTNRIVTGCDCSTIITSENVSVLITNNYSSIGRYLTGRYKLTDSEIRVLTQNNIRIFPIFQRSGEGVSATVIDYFTTERAILDATDAYYAAKNLGFGTGSIIYFAVDFDAYDYQVTSTIIPFYKSLSDAFNEVNVMNYRIGIYGPRNICSRIGALGYAVSSFVSDMSTAYSGNLGYPMPSNWAFDQIATIKISDSSTGKSIEIDKNVVRGTYLGELVQPNNTISLAEASKLAKTLSTAFEGNDGYKNIAGNSDGQGLSLGAIQWNIGSGTLQPLLIDIITKNRNLVLSIFGDTKTTILEDTLNLTLEEQRIWAISINDGKILKDEWKIPFQSLCETEDFIEIQERYMNELINNNTVKKCNLFNLKSNRSLALMFDISVHNGGFNQSEIDTMRSQINDSMNEHDKMIIIANVLGNARGEDSRVRSLCIVNGTGTVHEKSYDLLNEYGINDFVIYDFPKS